MARWRPLPVWVIALGTVPFVAVALTMVPSCLIDRSRQAALDCVNEIYTSGAGEAADCDTAGRLWWPKLVPWKREQALAAERWIESRVAEYSMDLAALRDLDRKARDGAARALLEREAGQAPSPGSPDAIGLVRQAGAVELAAAGLSGPPSARRSAIEAAVSLGDWAAAGRLAALPSPPLPPLSDKASAEQRASHGTGFDWWLEQVRGPVLCLTGRAREGRAALAAAQTSWTANGSPPRRPEEAARLLCGAKRGDIDAELRDWLDVLVAGLGLPGSTLERRPPSPDAKERRWQVVSLLVSRAEPDLHRVLALIAPDLGDLFMPADVDVVLGTAWTLVRPPTGVEPDAPVRLAAAAARLDAIAGRAPARLAGDALRDEIDPVVLANPGKVLRWVAFFLDVRAAIELVRRGMKTEALASLARARAQLSAPSMAGDPARDLPMFLIAPLHVAGDTDGALALCRELAGVESLGGGDALSRAMVSLNCALVRAGRGDWTGALADARALRELARSEAGQQSADLRRLTDDAEWLIAALAVRTGRGATLPGRRIDPRRTRLLSEIEDSLSHWTGAATAPAATRAAWRWQAHGDAGPLYEVEHALPAAYYLVGAAAAGGDVELFLDATLGGGSSVPAHMAARAEAARWRGDAVAAALWERRLASYRAALRDDRAAVLAAILDAQ
jgi:hypothetical protein